MSVSNFSMPRSNPFKRPDIHELTEQLIMLHDAQEDCIAELKCENEHLKSENYKDEELIKMQEKVKVAEEEKREALIAYYRGFPISKEEEEFIHSWQKQHDIKEHGNKNGYHGAIGGYFSYRFVPTSIGTIGECRCNTCERNAYEFACKEGKYNREAFEEYMKDHNGRIIFQDL